MQSRLNDPSRKNIFVVCFVFDGCFITFCRFSSSFLLLFIYFVLSFSLRHSVHGEKSIVWLSHSMWQRNRKKEFPRLFTNGTQTNNTKKISSSILVVSDYYHTNNNEVLIQLCCSCCRILPCVSICADIWRKLIRYSVEQGRVQLLRDLITQNTVDKDIKEIDSS